MYNKDVLTRHVTGSQRRSPFNADIAFYMTVFQRLASLSSKASFNFGFLLFYVATSKQTANLAGTRPSHRWYLDLTVVRAHLVRVTCYEGNLCILVDPAPTSLILVTSPLPLTLSGRSKRDPFIYACHDRFQDC